MADDAAAIRQVMERWAAATRAGDVPAVLRLMTDDVVFQVPGRQPFGKSEFERLARAPAAGPSPQIDAEQHVDELEIVGDLAYVRSSLRISVTRPGGEPIERVGTTLSIFRKVSGQWLLARDANLVSTVPTRG